MNDTQSPIIQSSGAFTGAVHPKVSLVILNPLLACEGNLRMIQVLNWNDPDALTSAFIADLRSASYGYVNYKIVERIVVDDFPPLEDGFSYSCEKFMRCWRARKGFHKPEGVDYHQLLANHGMLEKVKQGVIDEVWTIGFPYAGFAESRMAGPGAFWCNSVPLGNTNASGRRFIVMAFNFERGIGEMLESYGHRAESILEHVFRDIPDPENLWKHFTRYDKTHPGQAEVGNIHFAPNSLSDYEWGSHKKVLSHSRAWLNFPDLSKRPQLEDCTEWGKGDIRAHHLWWYQHIPHVKGMTGRISNNWWEYIVDPNRA